MAKAGRKADETKHKEIVSMYEAGVRDINQFVEEVGMSSASVKRVLKAAGHKLPRAASTAYDVAQVCDDYESGLAVKEILSKHSISVNTLYTILAQEEVAIRKHSEGNLLRKDTAIEMYESNAPINDIIQETGLGTQQLYSEIAARRITQRHVRHEDTINEAVKKYKEGATINEIIMEVGISSGALYQELDRRGIPRKGHSKTSAEQVDKAVEMYRNGSLIEQVYISTKVTPTVLYRALGLRGIAKRGHVRDRLDDDVLNRAVEMYQSGNTVGEIWDETKVASRVLYQELRKRGLELRP